MNCEEPATISTRVIADFLEWARRPRMAAYVRDFGDTLARVITDRDRLRERLNATLERLHEYEPPARPAQPVNHRSEWD